MQFEAEQPEAVRVFLGGKITEAGAYIGTIEKAYDHVAETGSVGIKFEFTSEQGQSAKWYLNTIKRDGSMNEIGVAEIQKQLMPLLGIKVLKEKQNDTMSFYDYDLGSDVDKKVTSYPQIMNKRIGIFFKMEESSFNGKTTYQPRVDFYFDPDTNQTAEEKANNKPANTMVLKLDRLNNTPAYTKHVEKKSETQQPTKTHIASSSQDSFDDDFEDNIPF